MCIKYRWEKGVCVHIASLRGSITLVLALLGGKVIQIYQVLEKVWQLVLARYVKAENLVWLP